jgi:hypothetical protein
LSFAQTTLRERRRNHAAPTRAPAKTTTATDIASQLAGVMPAEAPDVTDGPPAEGVAFVVGVPGVAVTLGLTLGLGLEAPLLLGNTARS